MSDTEFQKLVEEGIDAIPERFLRELSNVAIVIEDLPTRDQLKTARLRNPYSLLGLYEGIPKTARWNYGAVLPDKITIFKKPIEAAARSPEEVVELVRDTVWHEIAHHFGFSEDRVRKAERKRKQKPK